MKRSFVTFLATIFLLTVPFSNQAQQPPQSPPVKPPQQQEGRIIVETKLVSLTVTVSDKNKRFVAGLEKADFEVYDDNVKQEIALFNDEDAPITLGIIYDVSGSMKPLTQRSLQALRGLFEHSHNDDEFFIIAFNDRPQLVQDFTSLPQEILNRTVFVKSKGSTALFDAIYLGLQKVQQGRHAKKALLIISDGEENSSRYSYGELKKHLRETDAQLYGIGISQLGTGVGTLESITKQTGGLTFFPQDESEVTDLYTRIALMLRHQYIIGFYPTDATSETRWHNLKLTVKAPKAMGKLRLDYRKGWQSTPR